MVGGMFTAKMLSEKLKRSKSYIKNLSRKEGIKFEKRGQGRNFIYFWDQKGFNALAEIERKKLNTEVRNG